MLGQFTGNEQSLQVAGKTPPGVESQIAPTPLTRSAENFNHYIVSGQYRFAGARQSQNHNLSKQGRSSKALRIEDFEYLYKLMSAEQLRPNGEFKTQYGSHRTA